MKLTKEELKEIRNKMVNDELTERIFSHISEIEKENEHLKEVCERVDRVSSQLGVPGEKRKEEN